MIKYSYKITITYLKLIGKVRSHLAENFVDVIKLRRYCKYSRFWL